VRRHASPVKPIGGLAPPPSPRRVAHSDQFPPMRRNQPLRGITKRVRFDPITQIPARRSFCSTPSRGPTGIFARRLLSAPRATAAHPFSFKGLIHRPPRRSHAPLDPLAVQRASLPPAPNHVALGDATPPAAPHVRCLHFKVTLRPLQKKPALRSFPNYLITRTRRFFPSHGLRFFLVPLLLPPVLSVPFRVVSTFRLLVCIPVSLDPVSRINARASIGSL